MQRILYMKIVLISLFSLFILMGASYLYSSISVADEQVVNAKSVSAKEEISSKTTEADLIEQIQVYLNSRAIDANALAVSIYNIDQQQTYEWNVYTDFISASLYKVPLAMLYYEFIEDGTMLESDTLTYCSTCYEEGGPIGESYDVGEQIPLSELLYDVIVYSDNTAGHILFEQLGGWNNYRNAILKYSAQNTSFHTIEENSFSADYAMDVLQVIYQNEERYAQLIEYMSLVYPEDYLNRFLPSSSAQKYGSYANVRNAMGIVYEEHPYLIVVLTNLGENGVEVIGDINKIAYDYFNVE